MIKTERLTGAEIPAYPEGFIKDGRLSIGRLYESFSLLESRYGWIKDRPVYVQELVTPTGVLKFPIEVYRTPAWGPAFWVLAGIHGEEPAGPNALAQNIEALAELGRKVPMVVFPLCNPKGYFLDWRYPNEYRDKEKGCSVGDCDWLLPDLESVLPKPRLPVWTSPESYYLPGKILELFENYPAVVSVDHHEDECLDWPYIYSQGELGAQDPIAKEVVRILKSNGLPIISSGITRFGELIIEGVVDNGPDGSVDELIAARRLVAYREEREKIAGKHVIVVETPTLHAPLERRVAAHGQIIQAYSRFWEMASQIR